MLNTTEEIKNKLDIVDFLKSYAKLVPAGKNFKGLCPFHKEKTPSFMVSRDRQSWHCFGSCGTGGDIFAFVMRYENLEFSEALRFLAEKAGVELRRADPAEQRQFGVLYDINNAAKKFFAAELKKTAQPLAYLKDRGLAPEIIEEFELGFAPAKTDALTMELIRQGFRIDDIERSGLAFKSDRGGFVDRFRGRVMFPIHNHFGKTVGFTGRIMPEFDNGAVGKYVNSPETPIFKKSKILYGFHKTKNIIREAGEALLVEGQMDFLMAYQDGVKIVVATSGTALTPDHLEVLAKYTPKVILSFDADSAGEEAAERAIDLINSFDLEVKLLKLPEPFKDPAELVEREPGGLSSAIKNCRPAMEFYFDKFLKSGINKKSLRAVLIKIKKMPSAIDRAVWIRALGEKSDFSERDLLLEMENLEVKNAESVRQEPSAASPEAVSARPRSRRDLIAENLISLAIAKNNFDGVSAQAKFLPALYREVLDLIKNSENAPNSKLGELVNTLSLKSGSGLDYDESELARELKKEYFKDKQKEVLAGIRLAETHGNEAELAGLMKEFDFLSREIHN